MKKVEVIIKGAPRSGKTSIALVIEQALQNEGICVSLVNRDGDAIHIQERMSEQGIDQKVMEDTEVVILD